MAKRNVTLSVDPEPIVILQARGVNLSEKANTYFHSLAKTQMNPSSDVEGLRETLEKQIETERATAEAAEFAERVKPFVKHYKDKMADKKQPWENHPERKEKYIADTCENLGITPEKFLKLVGE